MSTEFHSKLYIFFFYSLNVFVLLFSFFIVSGSVSYQFLVWVFLSEDTLRAVILLSCLMRICCRVQRLLIDLGVYSGGSFQYLFFFLCCFFLYI
ncbi:hypothetical protein FKM82_002995 [Ascaphus truei]